MSSEFPMTKLLGLLIRQISSPVATRIKEYAKNHEFFKKHVCMAAGQVYHWWELRAKLWILKLGRPVSIPVLNERDAVNLGGNILGEAVVFFIGSSVLVAELSRQAYNEEQKKELQKAEMDAKFAELVELQNVLRERAERIAQLAVSLREHERKMLLEAQAAAAAAAASPPELPKASDGLFKAPEEFIRKIFTKLKFF